MTDLKRRDKSLHKWGSFNSHCNPELSCKVLWVLKHFSSEDQMIDELKAEETKGFALSHKFLMQYLSPILQVECVLRNEGREDLGALPDPYSTGLGLGPTSLLLCIALAFNALHGKFSPPKSN